VQEQVLQQDKYWLELLLLALLLQVQGVQQLL
jgi:hypothetical protein